MRFYGISSEDKAMEMVESISEGEWVFEEEGNKRLLSLEEARLKLKELVELVKSWKSQMKHLPAYTALIFVHEPSEPKAFKIYDLTSLGCASSLNPPRWKLYRRDIEAQLSP
ncbi:MAG: hypothetical protein RMK21_00295 [Aquificaceae bacterium]|nr:hypothetical protein [Aquificaceae bacterium]